MLKSTSRALGRRGFLKLLAAVPVGRRSLLRQNEKLERRTLYLVPNMHDCAMGWLSPFHVARNYALNTYLEHQDLAMRDSNYKYIFSEIPNLISMMELEPARLEELKGLIAQGRVELVNAFVLEATINLAGGEALVKSGVDGLWWYQQVMKASPRYAYMINVLAWFEQMAQIVSGLELEAFIYCRYNPTDDIPEDRAVVTGGESLHWIESPDGTRALAFNPGHYTGPLQNLWKSETALPANVVRQEIQKIIDIQRKRWGRFPKNAPMLTFTGRGDYMRAPLYKGYPAEALNLWEDSHPDTRVVTATLNDWFEVAKPQIDAGNYDMQVIKTGSKIYGWSADYVNAPRSKQWYRRCEHALQATEALNTIVSLESPLAYPSQELFIAWFLMALCMCRDPLWGAAVSGVFEHPKGWDMRDRYELVDTITGRLARKALSSPLGEAQDRAGLFNPSSWEREEVFELALPSGKSVKGTVGQLAEDGNSALVSVRLPSIGVTTLALRPGATSPGKLQELSGVIENDFYSAKVDRDTGALVSLKLKPSGREILGGRANTVLAEIPDPDRYKIRSYLDWPCYVIPVHAQRKKVVSSSDHRPVLTVHAGPLATILDMTCPFRGGELRRVMRFYKHMPRIDFVTETNDLPDGTIVSAEFPFCEEVEELRRGIPYGYAKSGWSQLAPEQRGNNNGILPVIRWSHYTLESGAGVALLDRGVPGRELVDRTAWVFLHNATDHFGWDQHPGWMSGLGKQRYQYALLAHETPWEQARIPQHAWDYNAPPLMAAGVAEHEEKSYVETSGNVLVEALRRVGDEIEMRMVECQGAKGEARVRVNLPHKGAALTNMLGHNPKPLPTSAIETRGAEYRFDIRPQQIVTMRFKTAEAVPPIQPITTYAPLIPERKREFTLTYRHRDLLGEEPGRGVPVWLHYE